MGMRWKIEILFSLWVWQDLGVYKPEEIEYMGKYGIKKIRIANGEKVWDKDFRFDSLGAYLSRSYKKILKQLETPIKKDKKKSLFDGF